MTIIYDATGAGASSVNSAADLSFTHIASGVNRAVIIGFALGKGPLGAADFTTWARSALYGGVPMTSLRVVGSNNSTNGFVELFGLLNPPTGAQTVVVSATKAATTPATMIAHSVSYTGVGSFANATDGFASAPPALTVTSATGDRAVAVGCSGSAISGPTQTQRALTNVNGNTSAGNLLTQDAAGAATVTLGAANNTDVFGWVGVSMIASVGGPTADPDQFFMFF